MKKHTTFATYSMEIDKQNIILEEANNPSTVKWRIWKEWKEIWRIAFPALLARVSGFGCLVTTQFFMGHIGALELAAFGLIQSILFRFVNGILLGMSNATETMCGQAFGARHYHMLGIYLQRSWIICFTTATIFVPVFIYTTPIFQFLREEEDIAQMAGNLGQWFIPLLYCIVLAFTIQQYLQAQLLNLFIGWLSAISFLVHVILSWIFVSKFDWGIPGAMGAYNIAAWVSAIGEIGYVFGGWCSNTWKGFSRAAFTDILPIVKLSMSSGIMLCLELWYSSILVLLAGYMKNATIAISAFSICLNMNTWVFMISLGFQNAACVRVSNELGRGNAEAAKFSLKVILNIAAFIGLMFWIIWLIYGHEIAYLLTSNEEIAEQISNLSPLVAFSMLIDCIQPILTGAAIGAGRQNVVAIINIGCYYVIGVPLGVFLGYVAGLQINGLWIGMLSGVAAQTIVLAYMTWNTDWDDEVMKASQRLNGWLLKPDEEHDQEPLVV